MPDPSETPVLENPTSTDDAEKSAVQERAQEAQEKLGDEAIDNLDSFSEVTSLSDEAKAKAEESLPKVTVVEGSEKPAESTKETPSGADAQQTESATTKIDKPADSTAPALDATTAMAVAGAAATAALAVVNPIMGVAALTALLGFKAAEAASTAVDAAKAATDAAKLATDAVEKPAPPKETGKLEADAEGRVTKVTDPTGKIYEFSYGQEGEIIGVKNAFGTWNTKDGQNWVNQDGTKWAGTVEVSKDGDYSYVDTATGTHKVIRPDGTKLVESKDGAKTESDMYGRVTQVTDANGQRYEFAYDDLGDVKTVKDAFGTWQSNDGKVWTNEKGQKWEGSIRVDAQGNYSYTDKAGNFKQLNTDGTKVVDNVDGSSTRTDKSGQLTEMTTPFGKKYEFAYDTDGKLTGMTNANGKWTTTDGKNWTNEKGDEWKGTVEVDNKGSFAFIDEAGVRTTVNLKGSEVSKNTDGSTLTLNPDGSKVEADPKGNVTKVTDAGGKVYEFGYDENSKINVVKNSSGVWQTEDGKTWTNEKGSVWKGEVSVDSSGNYIYKNEAGVEKVTKPDGTLLTKNPDGSNISFDRSGNVVQIKDAAGQTYGFQYDANNKLIGVDNAQGHWKSEDGKTWINDNGKTWKGTVAVDANGNYEYVDDSAGTKTTLKTDASVVTEYKDGSKTVADADGDLTSVTTARGDTYGFTYDELGNVVGMKNGQGDWKTTDGKTWTNEKGDTWEGEVSVDDDGTFTYTDKAGVETIKYMDGGTDVTQPDGSFVERDKDGRITSTMDANGKYVEFVYDEKGNIAEIDNEDGHWKSTDGNTWVRDSDGHVWVGNVGLDEHGNYSSFDQFGRTTTEKPDGSKRYDYVDGSAIDVGKDGKVAETTDANGTVRKFTYDENGKLAVVQDGTARWIPVGENAWANEKGDQKLGQPSIDASGNYVWTDDKGARTKLMLDGSTEVVESNGSLTRHDDEGKLTRIVDATGHAREFEYDDKGKLVGITDGATEWTLKDNGSWQSNKGDTRSMTATVEADGGIAWKEQSGRITTVELSGATSVQLPDGLRTVRDEKGQVLKTELTTDKGTREMLYGKDGLVSVKNADGSVFTKVDNETWEVKTGGQTGTFKGTVAADERGNIVLKDAASGEVHLVDSSNQISKVDLSKLSTSTPIETGGNGKPGPISGGIVSDGGKPMSGAPTGGTLGNDGFGSSATSGPDTRGKGGPVAAPDSPPTTTPPPVGQSAGTPGPSPTGGSTSNAGTGSTSSGPQPGASTPTSNTGSTGPSTGSGTGTGSNASAPPVYNNEGPGAPPPPPPVVHKQEAPKQDASSTTGGGGSSSSGSTSNAGGTSSGSSSGQSSGGSSGQAPGGQGPGSQNPGSQTGSSMGGLGPGSSSKNSDIPPPPPQPQQTQSTNWGNAGPGEPAPKPQSAQPTSQPTQVAEKPAERPVRYGDDGPRAESYRQAEQTRVAEQTRITQETQRVQQEQVRQAEQQRVQQEQQRQVEVQKNIAQAEQNKSQAQAEHNKAVVQEQKNQAQAEQQKVVAQVEAQKANVQAEQNKAAVQAEQAKLAVQDGQNKQAPPQTTVVTQGKDAPAPGSSNVQAKDGNAAPAQPAGPAKDGSGTPVSGAPVVAKDVTAAPGSTGKPANNEPVKQADAGKSDSADHSKDHPPQQVVVAPTTAKDATAPQQPPPPGQVHLTHGTLAKDTGAPLQAGQVTALPGTPVKPGTEGQLPTGDQKVATTGTQSPQVVVSQGGSTTGSALPVTQAPGAQAQGGAAQPSVQQGHGGQPGGNQPNVPGPSGTLALQSAPGTQQVSGLPQTGQSTSGGASTPQQGNQPTSGTLAQTQQGPTAPGQTGPAGQTPTGQQVVTTGGQTPQTPGTVQAAPAPGTPGQPATGSQTLSQQAPTGQQVVAGTPTGQPGTGQNAPTTPGQQGPTAGTPATAQSTQQASTTQQPTGATTPGATQQAPAAPTGQVISQVPGQPPATGQPGTQGQQPQQGQTVPGQQPGQPGTGQTPGQPGTGSCQTTGQQGTGAGQPTTGTGQPGQPTTLPVQQGPGQTNPTLPNQPTPPTVPGQQPGAGGTSALPGGGTPGQPVPGQPTGGQQAPTIPGQQPTGGQQGPTVPGQQPTGGQQGPTVPGQQPTGGQQGPTVPGQQPTGGQQGPTVPGQQPTGGQQGPTLPGQQPTGGQQGPTIPGQQPTGGQQAPTLPGQQPTGGQGQPTLPNQPVPTVPGQQPGQGPTVPGQQPTGGQPGQGPTVPGQQPTGGQPGQGPTVPGQQPTGGQPGQGPTVPGQQPTGGQPGQGPTVPGQQPTGGQPGQGPTVPGQQPTGGQPGQGPTVPGQQPTGGQPGQAPTTPGHQPTGGQPGQAPTTPGQQPTSGQPGHTPTTPGQQPSAPAAPVGSQPVQQPTAPAPHPVTEPAHPVTPAPQPGEPVQAPTSGNPPSVPQEPVTAPVVAPQPVAPAATVIGTPEIQPVAIMAAEDAILIASTSPPAVPVSAPQAVPSTPVANASQPIDPKIEQIRTAGTQHEVVTTHDQAAAQQARPQGPRSQPPEIQPPEVIIPSVIAAGTPPPAAPPSIPSILQPNFNPNPDAIEIPSTWTVESQTEAASNASLVQADALTLIPNERPEDIAAIARFETSEKGHDDQQIREAQERTRREKDEKDERERKEEEARRKKEIEEEARRVADTAAMLATRRAQESERARRDREQKDREQKERIQKELKKEQRRKYVIKDRDTLESIASKIFADKKLAPLIFNINKDIIKYKTKGDVRQITLKAGLVIFLPTAQEMRNYRSRPGKLASLQFVYLDEETGEYVEMRKTLRPSEPHRSNTQIQQILGVLSESAGHEQKLHYVVRLGDTLQSVALRHPALRDIGLWKLLAEINSLDTAVDEHGKPLASLKRGVSLIIPTEADIREFRRRQKWTISPVPSGDSPGKPDITARDCPECGHIVTLAASICPACGHAFETAADALLAALGDIHVVQPEEEAETPWYESHAVAPASTIRIERRKGPRKSDDKISVQQTIEQLGETTRLVKRTVSGSVNVYSVKLEVINDGTWMAVVSYDVKEKVSVRHEFMIDGRRRSISIDLPADAAQQLADNDIENNWRNYCQWFLAGRPISD